MASLDDVATLPTIGFALVIAIITTMFRRIVELRWPTLSKVTAKTPGQMVWEKLALPAVPVLFAVTFCLVAKPSHFDYPAVAAKNLLSRIIYGICVGWFADFGYRALIFFFKKKWNVEMPGASDAPGPTPEARKAVNPPPAPPPEVP